MRQANPLTRLFGLLLTFIAFSLPAAGRTQITLTEEFEGKIGETKPARLFHPVLDTFSTWLTSAQESEIRQLIASIDDITIQDALENVVLLDMYFEGQYPEVINETQKYIKKYPNGDPVFRPHILFVLAESYYYQTSYNDAKDIYREIRDEHSSYSEVYPHARHGLAWSYMHLGRYEEASEEFFASNATEELTVSMLFGYGINKYNEGKYLDAVESLVYLYDGVRYKEEEDATLILGPRAKEFAKKLLPRAIYYTGLSYYRLNDLDSAIRYAKEAADDYSHDSIAPIATYQTAWWSFQNLQYNQAIEYFNKALKVASQLDALNQDSTSIRLLRSQAYYNAGQIPAAMSGYRAILQDTGVRTGRREAEEGLDFCYKYIADSIMNDPYVQERDVVHFFEKEYGKELPRSPNLAHYEITFAWEYYENGNYDEVLEWTSKALATLSRFADEMEWEYDIFEAHKLRIFSYKEMEDWLGLAREADLLMKTFKEGQVTEEQLLLLIFMAGAHQERGNALYDEGNNYEAKKAYQAAIPLYERWLEEAPEDHPNREQIQVFLDYCIGRTK